jgi:hypothetical protein
MSTIHSSWVLLARRSAPMAGSARLVTVSSKDASSAGSAKTAKPAHSRLPALVVSVEVVMDQGLNPK